MDGIGSRLALAALALLASACMFGGDDALVERCGEVIAYKHPSLVGVDIVAIARDPSTAALTLDFEATEPGPPKSDVASRIVCDFEVSERWTLEAVELGGRALNETEVALVNSELLLRDLSRDPERLAGARF